MLNEPLGILACALFGLVGLIFLVEILERVVADLRRSPPAANNLQALYYAGSFSLRRPDSVLRERYHSRIRPGGRFVGINRIEDDPHDP